MVGFTVVSHQTGPVHSQYHVEVINGHIMQKHIVGALQKSGIYRKYRKRTLFGHPGGHGDGGALGDPYIKKAVWKRLGKPLQPCSPGHGGGNGTHPPVLSGQPSQGPAKNR